MELFENNIINIGLFETILNENFVSKDSRTRFEFSGPIYDFLKEETGGDEIYNISEVEDVITEFVDNNFKVSSLSTVFELIFETDEEYLESDEDDTDEEVRKKLKRIQEFSELNCEFKISEEQALKLRDAYMMYLDRSESFCELRDELINFLD